MPIAQPLARARQRFAQQRLPPGRVARVHLDPAEVGHGLGQCITGIRAAARDRDRLFTERDRLGRLTAPLVQACQPCERRCLVRRVAVRPRLERVDRALKARGGFANAAEFVAFLRKQVLDVERASVGCTKLCLRQRRGLLERSPGAIRVPAAAFEVADQRQDLDM